MIIIVDFLRTTGLGVNHTVIDFVTTVLDKYSNWYNSEYHIMEGKEILHLRHDLGKNWSIFLAEVISTLFEQVLNNKVKIDFLDSSLTIEVSLKEHIFYTS